MKKLYNLSIKNRLIGIILLVSVIVLLLEFIVTAITNINSLKSEMLHSTIIKANLIGEYCVAPLVFKDTSGAEDVLTKLQNIPFIQYGCVFNEKGEIFASYGLKAKTGVPPLPVDWEASEFKDKSLHVFQPILYKGERYGSIYLRVSTVELGQRIRNYLLLLGLLLIGLIIFSYLLANRLQRIISHPILKLAEVTKEISDRGDYSVRVEKKGTDEIGILYDEFNNMLETIQLREKERDNAEEALITTKEQYRILAEQAGQMVYDYNILTGKITWSGDILSITGCTTQEFQKIDFSGWENLIHPDDQKYVSELRDEAMKKCSAFQIEYRFKQKDGKFLFIEDNGLFLSDEKGNTIQMLGIMKDISERKQTEQELKKYRQHLEELIKERTKELKNAQEELIRKEKLAVLGQLAGGVGHELRNPLGSIKNAVYFLNMAFEEPEPEVKEILEILEKDVARFSKTKVRYQ